MPRKMLLTPEQVSRIEEMLKAGSKVQEIAAATGAKPYQVNHIKRKLGLVKERRRKTKPAKVKTDAKALKPEAPVRKSASELSVADIRRQLEAAQREAARWQQMLLDRVEEIEKMIAALKQS